MFFQYGWTSPYLLWKVLLKVIIPSCTIHLKFDLKDDLKVGLNVLISFPFIEGMAYAHLLDDSCRLLHSHALPGLCSVFSKSWIRAIYMQPIFFLVCLVHQSLLHVLINCVFVRNGLWKTVLESCLLIWGALRCGILSATTVHGNFTLLIASAFFSFSWFACYLVC